MPILVYKEDINKYTPIVIREDGGGDNPTLWFPMPASIGLYYSMEIVMKDSLISSAKINQDNSWFCIFDENSIRNIHTNHEYDLDHVESHDAIVTTFDDKHIDENDPIDSIDKIVTTEVNYDRFLFGSESIIIIFQGSLAGEYKEDIHITTTDGKHYTIPVGIEVYDQDESLDINLKNMGVELPYSIDNALYNKNILEENHDWVLINQKWKELLVSYMDIIGNKGSYKSLGNSLKWFGYDRLVEMRELWQYKTPSGRNLLMDRTIEPILLGISRSMLQEARKTTSFLLRNKVSDTIYTGTSSTTHGRNIYRVMDFDESNFNDCRWDIGIMMTKMTLLGLFIDKYFFPVSAEVWKSTVEHIIYDTIEIETDSLHTTSIISNNTAQDIPKGEIDIPTTDPDDPNKGDSDDPDHPDNPDSPSIDPGNYIIDVDDHGSTCDINMHLGLIDCIAIDPRHPDDPTGSFTTNAAEYEKPDGDTAMIGILPKTDIGTDDASIYASLRSFYRGLGGAVRIKITQTDEDKKDNKPFYDKAELRYVYPMGDDKKTVAVERSMKISPGAHSIDMYLFFDHIGTNVAMLTLYKGNDVYTKRFNVNVIDNVNLELRYFKFVRRENTANPFLPTSLPAYNKYMFSRIYREDPADIVYDLNDTSWVNKIHLPVTSEILSQLIIIKCDDSDFDNVYNIITKDEWLTQSFYIPSSIVYDQDWDNDTDSPQTVLRKDDPRNFFGVHKIYKPNTTKLSNVDKVIKYDENQPYQWGIYIVPKILSPRDKKAEYDKYCLARVKQTLKDAQVKVAVTAKQAFIPELCSIQQIGLDYDSKFIRPDDLIMIVPVMSYTSDKTIFLPYSSNVDNNTPWSAKSVYGVDNLITLNQPTQTALIGSSHKKPLAPGWYDVQFSYAVCGKKNDIIDKGAFCIREKNNN